MAANGFKEMPTLEPKTQQLSFGEIPLMTVKTATFGTDLPTGTSGSLKFQEASFGIKSKRYLGEAVVVSGPLAKLS